MALVGRVVMETHLMEATLSAVPETVLEVDVVRQISDREVKLVCWARGGDVSGLESGFANDPTVTDFVRMTEVEERPLYRITLIEPSGYDWVYPVLVENDIVVLNSTVTAEAQTLLARFPDRDAVVTLRDACRENGIGFRLEHLYREEAAANDGGVDSRYGVTEAQREALLRAHRAGYFDVPRRTKLETVAGELGISTQALSTRLRRGQTSLLENTLALESDT